MQKGVSVFGAGIDTSITKAPIADVRYKQALAAKHAAAILGNSCDNLVGNLAQLSLAKGSLTRLKSYIQGNGFMPLFNALTLIYIKD